MKEWQAIFRAFGQLKNFTYLHFHLPDGIINISGRWGNEEELRWQRVKEDFEKRKVRVMRSRSNLHLINMKKTNEGFRFRYDLKATWDLEQKGKRFQQSWYEKRICQIRQDGGWFLDEDRLLVEEGSFSRMAKHHLASPIMMGSGRQKHPQASELAGLYLRLPRTHRGYDRQKAVEYAHRYWNGHNHKFKHFDVDCTNYVSQCLWAGGAPMTYRQSKSEGWWYQFSSSPQWSYSWTVAHALRWYLGTSKAGLRAEEVSEASQLMPGDVICYDFEGDGRFNHTTIVVGKDGNNEPLVNAHTSNSRNRYWAYRDSTAWTPEIRYKFFRIIV